MPLVKLFIRMDILEKVDCSRSMIKQTNKNTKDPTVSLYSTGCPGTCFIDHAGLKIRDPFASVSWVLGLKTCNYHA